MPAPTSGKAQAAAASDPLSPAGVGVGILVNYVPASHVAISEYAVDFFHTRVKVANVLLGALMLTVWYLAFLVQIIVLDLFT